ncbi:MAG: hypothetical protein A2722_02660 [Candidatus Doudnabacteria bacterium RIFCSPHIGHO2_01_FULL_50_11]|uniref:EamA domain-containing protein n=1 Tax=Candidatus Doudnabacteria bacterium RIFCSPHIGHO2_01_FULL_50_11 TaxID=1817828 RepID=A0A1F5PLR6_9BACT|nr:MAG: hypothetical protein A2722_02660 [Candidatus Doudnabacteria bacterium RIFCSPHIGHO2_01_FULL_50_11]
MYILVAIAGYLTFAVNSVIDKFLLRRAIPEPATYAFFISMLSLSALLLAPFGYFRPENWDIGLALLSGACFTGALIVFFAALKRQDASAVLPFVGGVVPLLTVFMSFSLSSERLSPRDYLAAGLLIAGSFLIGWAGSKKHGAAGWIVLAIVASALFASSFTLVKIVYLDLHGAFVPGLIWSRVGGFLAALLILLHPMSRRKIFSTSRAIAPPSLGLFFLGQALASGAAIAQNYALSLGSVTMVNALQGTQFAFLFVLTSFLSKKYPKILFEDFSRGVFFKKILAILLISAGLIAIF